MYCQRKIKPFRISQLICKENKALIYFYNKQLHLLQRGNLLTCFGFRLHQSVIRQFARLSLHMKWVIFCIMKISISMVGAKKVEMFNDCETNHSQNENYLKKLTSHVQNSGELSAASQNGSSVFEFDGGTANVAILVLLLKHH